MMVFLGMAVSLGRKKMRPCPLVTKGAEPYGTQRERKARGGSPWNGIRGLKIEEPAALVLWGGAFGWHANLPSKKGPKKVVITTHSRGGIGGPKRSINSRPEGRKE
jgi:hypothetical protein